MEPIIHYPSLERAFNLARQFVLIDKEHRDKFECTAVFQGDPSKIVVERNLYNQYMNDLYDAEIDY